MESSSSNSVNSTPGWSGGARSNSAPAADPMAFFDLIMKSSQAMASKGNKSFDPVASTNTVTAPGDPYTAPTDDPNLHDGYDDSSTCYTNEVCPKGPSDADQPIERSSDEEDTAAVTEFSERSSEAEDEQAEPDQAALETSAATTQHEQLLSAPDTLAEGELAEVEEQGAADIVRATGEKTDLPVEAEAKTDQPLDTAKQADDNSNEQHDSVAEVTTSSARKKSKETDDQAFAVEGEELVAEGIESNPGEEIREVRSKEKGKLKLESLDQGSEEKVEAEVVIESGDTTQDDSSERKPRSASAQRSENSKANSVDVVDPTTNTSPDTSTVAAVTKASEALAAAASGTTTGAAPSATSSAPTNGSGVNNLATLLQRGIQRGSLQKAEGSQSPQLDPKQQIRLINRVARAVESTPPGQSIKIRLNPSELGQLKVEIKIENGNMTAKIEAENAATKQVLLENLPQLRERLAESNINVQQFEVELMGQQTPQDGSASTFADQSDQQGGSQTTSRHDVAASVEEESAATKRETVNKDAERDSRNLNVTV